MAGALPDDFWLEWHPTRSVLLDVLDAEWLTLAGSIQDLDCSHGFEQDVGRIEAGQLVAVVKDSGRNLDPSNRQSLWFPNLTPLRHLRLIVRNAGVNYVVWRGYTSNFKPVWENDALWAQIEAWDTLEAAARAISETVIETAISTLNPDFWFPLTDGGATIVNGAGRSPVAIATGTVRHDAILPYGESSSTSLPYAGTSKIDVAANTPTIQVGPSSFTVMAIFKADKDDAQVLLSAGPQPVAAACPSGDVAFTVDAGGTYSLRVGNAGGSSICTFSQPHNDVSTLVFGHFNAGTSQIGLEATIGTSSVGGGSVATGPLFLPRPGILRVGAGLDAANANPFVGSLSHVVLWQRLLTDAEMSSVERAYWGRLPYDGTAPLSQATIGWVLDRLGIPVSRRSLATGAVPNGGTATGQTGLEIMSRAANTEGGYFYADRQGNYVFKLRGAKGTYRGVYDTRPPAGSGNRSLADLEFKQDDRSFYTAAKTLVTSGSKQGQEVVYRHPNASQYGDVMYNTPTQFFFQADALAAAVAAVGDATPRIQVTEATVKAGATGVTIEDLVQSDVLDEIDVIARIPGGEATVDPLTWGVTPFWSFGAQDSFTRANAATNLGSTEGGSLSVLTGSYPWVQSAAQFGISSNQAYRSTAWTGVFDDATVDTGAVDHESSVVVIGSGGDVFLGPVVRRSAAQTFVYAQCETGGTITLYSFNAGVYTALGTTSQPWVSGDTITLRAVGSTFSVFRNGTLVLQVVSALSATGTRAGFCITNVSGTSSRIDNALVQSYPRRGWAGPPPYSQRLTILHVQHHYDSSEHAWTTTWALTPS